MATSKTHSSSKPSSSARAKKPGAKTAPTCALTTTRPSSSTKKPKNQSPPVSLVRLPAKLKKPVITKSPHWLRRSSNMKKFKKGDLVLVTGGKDKGKTGKIIK